MCPFLGGFQTLPFVMFKGDIHRKPWWILHHPVMALVVWYTHDPWKQNPTKNLFVTFNVSPFAKEIEAQLTLEITPDEL